MLKFYGEGQQVSGETQPARPFIVLERLKHACENTSSRVQPDLIMIEAVHQMHKLGEVHGHVSFRNVAVTTSGKVCACVLPCRTIQICVYHRDSHMHAGGDGGLLYAVDLEKWDDPHAAALGLPWHHTAWWWNEEAVPGAYELERHEWEQLLYLGDRWLKCLLLHSNLSLVAGATNAAHNSRPSPCYRIVPRNLLIRTLFGYLLCV